MKRQDIYRDGSPVYDIYRDDPSTGGVVLPSEKTISREIYRGSDEDAWLKRGVDAWVATKQPAISLTPLTELVVTNSASGQNAYQSTQELVTAAFSACQGSAGKSVQTGALSAALASVTSGVAAAGQKVFGWRVRYTASYNNFDYAPLFIDVGLVLNNAGVFSIASPIMSLMVVGRRMPIDLLVLSVNNAGSKMTIVQGTSGEVIANGSTTTAPGLLIRAPAVSGGNFTGTIESLNARDLTANPIGQQLGGRLPPASSDDPYSVGIR